MSYSLNFTEDTLPELERLGLSDKKKLRQVLIKLLSLRDNPYPQESKQISAFGYMGYKGLRLDHGNLKISYAVDEKAQRVLIARIVL